MKSLNFERDFSPISVTKQWQFNIFRLLGTPELIR